MSQVRRLTSFIRSLTLTCVLAVAAGAPWAAADGALPRFGLTVISHGYQFTGTLPAWPETLAGAIRAHAGGRVFQYRPDTGALDLIAGALNEGGETILIFDWARESRDTALGRSEAAADALLAALMEHSRGSTPLIPLAPLHLIGHSRGTVVGSELAERLIANGIDVDHVTTLDPHDWGNAGIPGASGTGITDWDVNFWHPQYPSYDIFGRPPGIQTWEGIGFADNYFQQRGASESLVDPWGKSLPGTANLGFPDSFDIGHSAVHAWYHGTIDTLAGTDGAGIAIEGTWFDNPGGRTECDASMRNWTLSRETEGFWFSRLDGGNPNRCPESEYSPGVARVSVRFSYALPEGIVNGDFERGVSGWSFHGGELNNGAAIGNGVLDLNLMASSSTTSSATHNRLFIPPDRTHLRFCLRVIGPDPDDRLRVDVGSDRRLSRKVDQTSPGCQQVSISLSPFLGTVQTLTFELAANGAGNARVFIDDVIFQPTDLLLRDGFESGGTWDWTSAAP